MHNLICLGSDLSVLEDVSLDDGGRCIFIATVQRSNLVCDGGGVLLQIIAAGAAAGEPKARALDNALAVANVLSTSRKDLP